MAQLQSTNITGSLIVSGSTTIINGLVVTGSVIATSFTGSLQGTASFATTTATASYVLNAVSASFASTASFVVTAQTASYVLNAVSASFVISASRAISASRSDTASLAVTASFVTTAQTASYVLQAVSASFSTLAQTANTASYVLQAVSASFATSSSQAISASFVTSASRTISSSRADTASFVITAQTASYVLNAVSASFATTAQTATTASYVLQAVSASFATSASQAISASFVTSASRAVSASRADTASFVTTAQTASYVLQAVSASFATSSSQAISASFTISSSRAVSASRSDTASLAVTASFVTTAQTASYVLQAVSASFAISSSRAVSASLATTALTASNITPVISNDVDTRLVTANGNGTLNGEGNLTFDGNTLKVLYQSGDEGGEILLNKSVTNNSLTGSGIVIDSYQNKLRFFEQGGNARGAYIDLTACSPSVGTNLLAGGGSSIAVSYNGTSVGTFTLLNFSGSGVTVTDKGGGTVDIYVPTSGSGGGGSPAGSDGQVQYNNGGAFGGAISMSYDDTNHRVGIGTPTPGHTLTVVGAISITGSNLNSTSLRFQDTTGVSRNAMFVSSSNWLTVGNTSYTGVDLIKSARISGSLFDVNNSSGSVNQVLTSTANGIAWATATGGSGSSSVTGSIYSLAYFDSSTSVTSIVSEHDVAQGFTVFNGSTPRSVVDVNNTAEPSQGFRIREAYTPTDSGDSNGHQGQIAWDDNYIYVKTVNNGWMRVELTAF